MHLKTRNVNTAFKELVTSLQDVSKFGAWSSCNGIPIVRQSSRNGNVFRVDEPVTITYTHPRERVLFNAARDANPFFHLYEALWMISGRNDVAPLAYYAKQMSEYSDDGKTLNGAYGYRWRHSRPNESNNHLSTKPADSTWWDTDQLNILVAHLKAQPDSRRAVLQMWNVEDDLLKIGVKETTTDANETWRTFNPPSKDVCCNLSVMFSIREVAAVKVHNSWAEEGDHARVLLPATLRYLDTTVTNRSNDMIWGLLGANYVHFTFLQEYMAARLGVEVGLYHHFTNNLHVYDWNWKPEEWLRDTQVYGYETGYKSIPLIRDPAVFERELPEFVEHWSNPGEVDNPFRTWEEPFLETVAAPLLAAFMTYKRRGATTSMWVERIAADDWRVAARGWIERRLNKKGKTDAESE